MIQCDVCSQATSQPQVVHLSEDEVKATGHTSFSYCSSCWHAMNGPHAVEFMVNLLARKLKQQGLPEKSIEALTSDYKSKLEKMRDRRNRRKVP